MYRYEVIKLDSPLPDQSQYGLQVRQEQGEAWPVIAAIYPFSSNMEDTSQLAEQCTSLQLSPIHMFDVIHNFIAAHSCT